MIQADFVRPPTLTAMVAASIREAVLRGDLSPGQRLLESALSKEYEVSRGTIREALRSLQIEGLIRIVPHRGAIVDTLTSRKVREAYSLRIHLESLAIEHGIRMGNYGPRVLSDLRKLLVHMANVRKTSSYSEVLAVDAQFHQELCAVCDFELLLELLQVVIARTRLCMAALAIGGSTILADPERHKRLLQAVQEGSVEMARDAVTEHFELGRDELLTRMEAQFSQGEREA